MQLLSKTYISFICDLGTPYFRLDTKHALGTFQGEAVGLVYRADQGRFHDVVGRVREHRQTGKISVLEITEPESDELLRLFLSAQSKVVMRIVTTTSSTAVYTFPAKGFYQAYKAVKGCD